MASCAHLINVDGETIELHCELHRFGRSRNLFHVCCSDPATRLLLFTRELSCISLAILCNCFNGAAESAPGPQEE